MHAPRILRLVLIPVVAAALAAFPGAPAVAADDVLVLDANELRIDGHGFGHGHGMSQHGAHGAARQGLSAKQITDFYYPGTKLGRIGGMVTVLISADPGRDVVVGARKRLTIQDSARGGQTTLPRNKGAKKWRIKANSRGVDIVSFRKKKGSWKRWRKLTGVGEFNAAGRPITLFTPAGKARYRGKLRAVPVEKGSKARHTVNKLKLETYLRGVVPTEMPALWHPSAVQAQAIAARTYAAFERSNPLSSAYQICDTTQCQVYRGADAEHPASNRAIKATARKGRLVGGKPAFTQFSASSGGWTSQGSRPYLPAQRDPYDDWEGNTVHDWRTTRGVGQVENAFPAVGDLQRIQVLSRDGNGEWGGRVRQLRLTGSQGSVTVSGDDFRFKLGLLSTWFDVTA